MYDHIIYGFDAQAGPNEVCVAKYNGSKKIIDIFCTNMNIQIGDLRDL